ncbi:hypothetical protein JW911_02505 [Candidatus Peregrinibacteria bacterium]|nr:hypothetical protein [Candidatus Peregrinibacteria bacterium]
MRKVIFKSSRIKNVKITLPGSKSLSIRALFIASLADGITKLYNIVYCDDVNYIIDALKNLGIKIIKKKNHLEVIGAKGKFKKPNKKLYIGYSGLGLRFLTALSFLTKFKIQIEGGKRLMVRPIKDLEKSLKSYKNGLFKISGWQSSQFLSAILIIAPLLDKNIKILVSEKLVSRPYIDMTIKIMKDFGVKVENINYKEFIIKKGQNYHASSYNINGDATQAVYFSVLSKLHMKKITTIKPELNIKEIKFGAENDLNNSPDSAIAVAILAALNKGKTKIINIENLRYKECDRIKSTVMELKKINIKCKELKDGFEIEGNPKKIKNTVLIDSHNDHRMVMSFALLGTKLSGLQILNPDCVSKSYPIFFNDLKSTGAKFSIKKIPNIILTGMRGSGKSTIGKIIANKLGYKFIDLDKEIEKHEKMAITEIVKQHGWAYFREKEKQAVKKLINKKDVVIATGGGTILDNNNKKLLKKFGKIIFINRNLIELEQNIKNDKIKRPFITNQKTLKEELRQLWKERKALYKKNADLIMNFNKNIGIEEKSEKIIMEL